MNKITSSSAAAAPQAAASRGTLLAGICTAAKAVVPAGAVHASTSVPGVSGASSTSWSISSSVVSKLPSTSTRERSPRFSWLWRTVFMSLYSAWIVASNVMPVRSTSSQLPYWPWWLGTGGS